MSNGREHTEESNHASPPRPSKFDEAARRQLVLSDVRESRNLKTRKAGQDFVTRTAIDENEQTDRPKSLHYVGS